MRRIASMGARSWTVSRHLFTRLDAIQPLLGLLQPGRHDGIQYTVVN